MSAFTKGELEVMEVLWRGGALKPAEIQQRFPRPIRNAALRSILLILLEKGSVARERRGKAYYYRALTPQRRTFRSMARRLAQVFCGGSSAALIAQLMRTEDLSDEDLRELRRIASVRKREKKRQ